MPRERHWFGPYNPQSKGKGHPVLFGFEEVKHFEDFSDGGGYPLGFLELAFRGIGGIDLGLERAGWTCRWQVEVDDYRRRVLTKHWPDVPKYGDVRELTGAELEPVDLVSGGFPCQPVSSAGRRQGVADERWLWPEFARLIRILRPGLILMENVPGLLSRGMGEVLRDLAVLGYDAEWSMLSACALGAPHARERVFLVAYTGQKLGRSGFFNGGATAGSWQAGESNRQAEESCRKRLATWWQAEPALGRLAYGFPGGVAQLGALGDAVVPQVAEWVGRRILEAINDRSS